MSDYESGYEYGLQTGLERALKAKGWQPIETAPKDGTRMLGHFGAAGVAIFKRHDPGGRYETWATDEGAACKAPLHWMPLPEPPK